MPSKDHMLGYPEVIAALYEPDPSFVRYTPPRQRLTKGEESLRKTQDAQHMALLNAGISPKTPVEEKPANTPAAAQQKKSDPYEELLDRMFIKYSERQREYNKQKNTLLAEMQAVGGTLRIYHGKAPE